MSRGRANSPEAGGGRLAALSGLALLSLVGFAVGLLAGAAWERPGLVLGYVFGGTEEVPWGPDATVPGDGAATDVAAAPPVGPQSAPAPKPEAAPTPRAAKPAPAAKPTRIPTTHQPVAAPKPASERVVVQVGAFTESSAAERLAASLKEKGFAAFVSPGTDAGSARWRVRVGPHGSRSDAEGTAARLKREESLPTWVLIED